MLKLVAALVFLANVAQTVAETLTTPGLDLTHGKLRTAASVVTFVLTSF